MISLQFNRKTTSYDGFSHGQNMMCRKKVTISSQPTSCNQHFDCKTLVSELVACGISDFDYWNETRWSEFAFKSLITEVFKWNSECLSRNLIINTNYSDSRKYGYSNHLWESVPMKRSDVDHVVPGSRPSSWRITHIKRLERMYNRSICPSAE